MTSQNSFLEVRFTIVTKSILNSSIQNVSSLTSLRQLE